METPEPIKRTTARLVLSLHKKIKRTAEDRGQTIDEFIRDAALGHLERLATSEESLSKTLAPKVKFQTKSSSTKQIDVAVFQNKLGQAQALIASVRDALSETEPANQADVDKADAANRAMLRGLARRTSGHTAAASGNKKPKREAG